MRAQCARRALFVVPLVLGVACTAAPPKATSPLNAYERSILARKAPPWVHQAEQETARYLRSRCFDLAPLADSWEASEDWRTCRVRASLADRATWAPLVAAALSECERTGVECCFRQVSDDERHNAHWQRACNMQCESFLGRPLLPARSCYPAIVESPVVGSRLSSPASRAIVASCATSVDNVGRCAELSTLPEKEQCSVECRWPYEERYYAARVDACVTEVLASRQEPRCTLDSEMTKTGRTVDDCKADCAASVRARLLSNP